MIPLEFLYAWPWIAAAVLLPFMMRRKPRMTAEPRANADDDGPLVSIVVPARNEAANIGACLATLLDSGYSNREIIVVDDHSTDGTGDIARILAERADGAVRVIEGQPLPPGWVGKCWACWQGYQAAHGDVLLFTDADTRHDENLLPHALGALLSRKVALVTVIPRQIMRTFWERTVLPQIFMLIYLRYRDLNRINSTRNPRDVIANGQFILMPRAEYEAMDGHRSVRGEIVEDLRLAQQVVSQGRGLFVANAETLMDTRMYRSLGQIVEGWTKNLALGTRGSVDGWLKPAMPWIAGITLIGFWCGPPVLLVASVLGLSVPGMRAWSIVATSASAAFWLLAYARLRLPVLHALLYPLGAAVAGMVFLRSAARGRTIGWKGRTYDLDTLAGAPPGEG